MSDLILGLSGSHADWARIELARQGVKIPKSDACSMAGLRRMNGCRPDRIYVYAPLNPGDSASTVQTFKRAMSWVRWLGKKNPNMKVFSMQTNGAVREWPEAL